MKYLLHLMFFLGYLSLNGQIPFIYTSSGNTSYSTGTTTLKYNTINVGNTNFNVSSSAQISMFGASYVKASPGFAATGLASNGFARLAIDPNSMNIGSFNTNGFSGIDKYSKFEIGIQLPEIIQAQINSFFAGNSGINPYNPDEITVFCSYDNVGSTAATYYRNGFYYRDFAVQNNNWTEQNTDYTFRVRFAPPLPGAYTAIAYLLINGSLTNTMPFSFTVTDNSNPGHLKMANGNLRKMQFENGDIFFGVGENSFLLAPFPPASYNCIPGYPFCVTPTTYDTYRNEISDIAANDGNFLRVRLDEFAGFPIEWEDKYIFQSDNRPLKSLINCLNNYDHNQAQMWEMDKVFSLCESNDLYFLFTIINDQSWNTGNPYGMRHPWSHNPYSALLGNNSAGIAAFFNNAQAKSYFKKTLYYITSRWGYSTNMAGWQMINETENIDGNADSSGGNPYLHSATFKQDVDQWICDMTSYLAGFYPFHPATTGYGGDMSGMPACLNIYSSNSYNNDLFNNTVQEGNFNSRAPAAFAHFNNFQPFVFGEMGTGDPLIDQNNDKDFHNSIWATTMMGGISCGLYWHDLEQALGVNHRANLRALRAFTQRVDWTQNFQPDKIKDSGCNDRDVLNFWQRNGAKNFIIGWSLNGSSVWANDSTGFVRATAYDSAKTFVGFSGQPDPYTVFTTNCNPEMKITGLLPSTNYFVRIFDTYDPTNQELSNFHTLSNSFTGSLTFRRKMPFDIQSPFYPDYAYIITTDGNRPAPGVNPDDSLSYNPGDTLCIDATKLLERGRYKYSWYVNQKPYGSDSIVCLNSVNYPPQIKVQLIAENEEKVKYYKDFIFNPQSPEFPGIKGMEIFVYPNPARDYIEIGMTGMSIDKFEVVIQNELGQIVMKKSTQNRINITSLINGFYVVKIVCGTEEKSIKLIINR